MRIVICASVAGPNRLKDTAGGKVESFLWTKGDESYCVDVVEETVTRDGGMRG